MRPVRALWRALEAVGVARGVAGARHEPPEDPDPDPDPDDGIDPSSYTTGAPAWAERLLAALLVATGVLLAAFAVLVGVDADTQLLGLTAGLGLVCLAAALILAGLRVVPQETAVEDRPLYDDQEQAREDERLLGAAADGVSRRRLITGAAGVAGTGLAAAVALPLTAIGPSASALDHAPWRTGIALVDAEDKPINADDLAVGSFVTAFPRGADKRELGSPLIVVHIEPAALRLPAARQDWAPEGLLAYSKICTHAGCAVALFRYPTYEPTSSPPALVCPCHYSTFDVARAAKVTFGPAGRPLPQLPLRLDAQRNLVAAGRLSGSVGPAWWGTDRG